MPSRRRARRRARAAAAAAAPAGVGDRAARAPACVAARFLLSYLQFAYGRASAGSVKAVTPGLRSQLITRARSGHAGRARPPPAGRVAGSGRNDARVRRRDGDRRGRRDRGVSAAVHAPGTGRPLAGEQRARRGEPAMAVVTRRRGVRVLVVVAAAVPAAARGRRRAAHGRARRDVFRAAASATRRRPRPSATFRAASCGSTSRSERSTRSRGRSSPGSARRSAIRAADPDPSCTPQPGATGPGVANFAGASGPMQIGIGGAAGDEYDVAASLPARSVAWARTIRRRRSSWRRSC